MWDFEKYADQTALLDETGTSLTYRHLDGKCRSLAEAAGHRCLVFCLCENSLGSVLGYAAFLQNRIVPILAGNRMEHGLVKQLLEKYQPSFIWGPAEQGRLYVNTHPVSEAYGYMLWRTDYDREYPLHDDLALLLPTSGSTGSPRFVRQTYDNLRANTESIVEYLKLNADQRPVTTLPMYYTYGLSVINTHLDVGACVLLTNRTIMQKEFWTFFNCYRATSLAGVPYTYEMLERLRFRQMDLPSLSVMTQAGGKLSSRLHQLYAEYAQKSGRKFYIMYGQCEATARMGYLPAEMAVRRKGAMGYAIPGGRFWLAGPDGSQIHAPHTMGELIYEGRNVTPGYAQCGEDLIKGDENHGVLFTGDMALFDEEGCYYITGRKKRFLKIFGNRISLDETEDMIRNKYGLDTACAGVDDHMYIFLAGKDQEKAGMARDYVIHKTGLHPSAFRTVVIDQIPRNDAGKIQYAQLDGYYDTIN